MEKKERIVTMSVIVEVTTNKDLEEIKAGINKGIYYGLDIKSVAEPKKVTIKEMRKTGEREKPLFDDEKMDKFTKTYHGRNLLQKYNLNDVATWDIFGEDENAELAGPHHNPFIGRVEGRLEDVIKWAVHQKNFWTWGGGGEIRPIKESEIKVIKL